MSDKPQQWIRKGQEFVPSARPWNPPTPEYDLETVENAIGAATDISRYDVAQDIVEEAGSDLCVICRRCWAEGEATTSDGVEIQVCSECAEWDVP